MTTLEMVYYLVLLIKKQVTLSLPLQQQVKSLNEARYNEIVALKESQRQRDEVASKAQEKKQAVEQEIKQEEESFQQALDEQWNDELQTNKDAFLKSAEKQLKEEKGPGKKTYAYWA